MSDSDAILEPRLIHMPEFAPGAWLNTGQPLTREQLRGRIVLIDFWDYTCINCLRTLAYLTRWHRRYAGAGLTIVGVHTPEFKFARLQAQVESAVSRLQLPYPVLLDNEYKTWDRFATKAWPTKFLVDGDGYIRFKRQGEGYYREIERALQILLRQRDPGVDLPRLLPPLREEDTPGAVCYRPTPELYAGYQGGGLFGGGLGNPEGYVPQNPVFYDLPETDGRQEGHFYIEGVWRAWPEAIAYVGQEGGKLVLPYRAASVNAVLAPSADIVEVMLDLHQADGEPLVEVWQDGRSLTPANAGADVEITENGRSVLRVTQPRLYEIARNHTVSRHELTMTFRATGLALYAFTFTSCASPDADPDRDDTFQVH